MATTPIVIEAQSQGFDKAKSDVLGLGVSAQSMAAQVKSVSAGMASSLSPYITALIQARKEQQALAAIKMPGDGGAASAWSPYIAALQRAKKEAADLKAQADTVKGDRGTASTWSPYIAAIQRAKREAAELKQQADAAKAARGPSSAWSPYISAVKQAQMEQQRLKQQAAAIKAAQGPSSAWTPYISQVKQAQMATAALARQKRALEEAAPIARNFGLGALAVSGAGATLGFKAAMTAGKTDLIKAGFKTSLGGSDAEADDLLKFTRKFDRDSPFDFQTSAETVQGMASQGFKKDEIKQWLPALGNAVAAGGGTSENLMLASRQISQIKGKGKITVQDANALAEGGRIPIKEIFTEAFGKERFADFQSGKQRITSDEALPAILKWIEKNRGKGMANAMDTLPGQIEMLNSDFRLLSETVGRDVMPIVKGLVTAAGWVANALSGLPGIIRKPLVYLGVLGVAIAGLAGIVVAPMAMLASLALTLDKLAISAAAANLANGGANVSSFGGIFKSIGGSLKVLLPGFANAAGAARTFLGSLTSLSSFMSIALPAAIAIGIALILKSAMDKAADQADKEAVGPNTDADPTLARGTKASLESEIANKDSAIAEKQKNVDTKKARLAEKGWVYDIIRMQSRSDLKAQIEGDENEIKSLKLTQDRLRKRALTAPTSIASPAATAGASMSSFTQSSNSPLSDDVGDYTGPSPDSYTQQIYDAQDAARNEPDKAKKKALQDRARQLGRDKVAAAKNQAAAKRAQAAQKRSAGLEAGADASEVSEDAQGRIDEIRDAGDERKDIAREANDKKIDAIRKQMKSGLLGKTAGQDRITALEDAARHREEALSKYDEAQIAQIQARAVMDEAIAMAAGKSADEAAAIMRKAENKKRRLLGQASRDMASGRREDEAANEAGNAKADGGLSVQQKFAAFLRGTQGPAVQGFGANAGGGGTGGTPRNFKAGNTTFAILPSGDMTLTQVITIPQSPFARSTGR